MIILILAAWLRISGLAWDDLAHFHPDERYITWVGSSIEFGGHSGAGEWLDPRKSRFNPFYWPPGETTSGIVVPYDEPRNFAYGHLPLYLGVGFTRILETVDLSTAVSLPDLEFDRLTLASRLLTALVDVGSVFIIFLIGRRLFSSAVGLLAAALLAVTVLHIQLAHFFISDTYLTFFTVLAVERLTAAVFSNRPSNRRWALAAAAVSVGLAVGSKFSAVGLGLPFLVALLFLYGRRFWRPAAWLAPLTVATFALTNPFAVIDFSCGPEEAMIMGRSVPISHCYLQNIARESSMVRGGSAFPFVRQYDGTPPLVYPVLNLLNWGLGWPLGVISFGGVLVGTGVFIRRVLTAQNPGPTVQAAVVILSWTVPYFLITAFFQVKFLRYMQPAAPFLILWGAWLLLDPLLFRRSGRFAAACVWLLTAAYAAAFAGMYHQPHPWTTASIWLYEIAGSEAVVAIELWDETLPTDLTDQNPGWSPREMTRVELNWLSRTYTRDDEEKLMKNLSTLAEANYWVVASNRSYGPLTRLPEVYPTSHAVHPALFDGSLGFEPVFIQDRPLRLGGITLTPARFAHRLGRSGPAEINPPEKVISFWDKNNRLIGPPVDESFTVYDQPLVMIFANQKGLSAEAMKEIINR